MKLNNFIVPDGCEVFGETFGGETFGCYVGRNEMGAGLTWDKESGKCYHLASSQTRFPSNDFVDNKFAKCVKCVKKTYRKMILKKLLEALKDVVENLGGDC